MPGVEVGPAGDDHLGAVAERALGQRQLVEVRGPDRAGHGAVRVAQLEVGVRAGAAEVDDLADQQDPRALAQEVAEAGGPAADGERAGEVGVEGGSVEAGAAVPTGPVRTSPKRGRIMSAGPDGTAGAGSGQCASAGSACGAGRGRRSQQQRGDHRADGEDRRRPPERGRVAVDRGLGHRLASAAPLGRERASPRAAAIVLSSAVPIEPPTCWLVLTIAEATPASSRCDAERGGLHRRGHDRAQAEAEQHQAGEHVGGVARVDARAGSATTIAAVASSIPMGTSGRGPNRGSSTGVVRLRRDDDRDHRQEREPGLDRREARASAAGSR